MSWEKILGQPLPLDTQWMAQMTPIARGSNLKCPKTHQTMGVRICDFVDTEEFEEEEIPWDLEELLSLFVFYFV